MLHQSRAVPGARGKARCLPACRAVGRHAARAI